MMGGIDSLSAYVRTQIHSIDVEDAATVIAKFSNGAIGTIVASTCVYPAQETRFEIHCEKGTIIFADSGIKKWQKIGTTDRAENDGEEKEGISSNPAALWTDGHIPVVQDLVNAIENDVKPAVTPREGRAAVDTILAIYKSSEIGKEVSLKQN